MAEINIPKDWELTPAQRKFFLELARRVAALETRVTALENP